MVQSVKTAADAVLNKAVNSTPGVPGVVAVATDRNANIYEGAFGVRQAGANAAMTADSVFAIFSTSKAITGTACLQLVEDGKLDLDGRQRPTPRRLASSKSSTASMTRESRSFVRRSAT